MQAGKGSCCGSWEQAGQQPGQLLLSVLSAGTSLLWAEVSSYYWEYLYMPKKAQL